MGAGAVLSTGDAAQITAQMAQPCISCQVPTLMVWNANNPLRIEAEPVEDGELVVVFNDDHGIAYYGIDPEGDEFWKIPAGAPRFRQHRCGEVRR